MRPPRHLHAPGAPFSPPQPLATAAAAAVIFVAFGVHVALPYGQWFAVALILCQLLYAALPPLSKKPNRRFLPRVCALAVLQGAASLAYLCNAGDLSALQIGLFAAVIGLAFYVLYLGLFARFASPLRAGSPQDGRFAMLQIMLLTLFALCLAWSTVFPASLIAPDTVNQLMQADGAIPYSKVHTVAHTLLITLFRRVDPGMGLLMATYYLAIALVNGLFGRLAYERGVPYPVIVLVLLPFLLPKLTLALYTQPLKDLPYSFCVAMITYFLIVFLERGVLGRGQTIALGASLAFAALFRYNGIVVAAVMGLYFLFTFIRRRQITALLRTAAAALVCIVGLGVVSSRVLHAESPQNGFSLQIFGAGIAAVVAENGDITPEQYARIERILPVDWMLEQYAPWQARRLIWEQRFEGGPADVFSKPDMQVFNNAFVLALGANGAEVLRLYCELFFQNPCICVRELFFGSHVVWGWRSDSIQFYYTNCFLTSVLLLALLARRDSKRKTRPLVVLLPILCNMLSILISTITNEVRYMMPTLLLAPLILLYYLSSPTDEARD